MSHTQWHKQHTTQHTHTHTYLVSPSGEMNRMIEHTSLVFTHYTQLDRYDDIQASVLDERLKLVSLDMIAL